MLPGINLKSNKPLNSIKIAKIFKIVLCLVNAIMNI